jgi:poly-gamma-glutamate synthase PgsB/CapB
MFDPGLFQASLIWMEAVTPAQRFLGALTVCLTACCFLWLLAALHNRRLARIPVRIHVAGTRGKSATVRLLAAALGAGGYRVVAKVTGTRPRIILPDGTERLVRRWGAAAIHEQRALVAVAHSAGANALVAEAMAIEPEYLHALEQFYIQATDLVVTNVRPDHQEQLGSAPDAMANAIAETVPAGGRLFLTAEAAVPLLLDRAATRNCEVSIITNQGSDPEDANRQLAVEVCRCHGIAADDAVEAMRSAAKDIGSLSIGRLFIANRTIGFANAFSCNDVDSFERLWRHHQREHTGAAFLFNPRSDRPVRSIEFFRLLARLAPEAPLFIAAGDRMLRRRAIAAGFSATRVHRLPHGNAEQMLCSMASRIPEGTVVWGCGNLYGKGLEICQAAGAFRASC